MQYLISNLIVLCPFLMFDFLHFLPQFLLLFLLFELAYLIGYLHLLDFELFLLQFGPHFIHNPFLLQLILNLDNLHPIPPCRVVGPINGSYIIDDIVSFLPHNFQLILPARFVMLHLNLQALLIIHAVFINSLYLLHGLGDELTRVDALSLAGLHTARTVQNGPATTALIEVL
jgi:hypothetical protein